MRALTVVPGDPESLLLDHVAEPHESEGDLLVDGVAIGICATDEHVASGQHGAAPSGEQRLILGHESLGRVTAAPDGMGIEVGDLVAGTVRMPGADACGACLSGAWDMCRSGEYVERGIKGAHGYAAERWRSDPRFAIRVAPHLEPVGVLLEPASVVAKAWDHVERTGRRAYWRPARVLVTGAGPIGLLATLMGRQQGFEVDVYDRLGSGPKPGLVEALGASYHTSSLQRLASRADVILECTGAGDVIIDLLEASSGYALTCLVGIPYPNGSFPVDAAALVRKLVVNNGAIVGTANAGRQHWEAGAEALAASDLDWLRSMITRRLPLSAWREAFEPCDDDVKVVIDFASGADAATA